MAYMYPRIRKSQRSYGRTAVYDELKKLPNDYIIFILCSGKKNLNRNFTWYENDYLIFHKDYGILLLEVRVAIVTSKMVSCISKTQ